MTRTRKAWATAIGEGDYRISELHDLINDWELADEELTKDQDKALSELGDNLKDEQDKVSKLESEIASMPEWGNCRRGCPPSYLDREGFCSPACQLGVARGQFVTPPQESIWLNLPTVRS